MSEQLEQTTKKRMRALCNKIAVAQDLDRAIQDELFDHMEDKLHAYLNGEEPLTEDDALLLVEKHFGNPAVVKSLMGHVHMAHAHVSLIRRLMAVLTVDILLLSATTVLFHIPVWILRSLQGWRPIEPNIVRLYQAAHLLLSLGSVVVLFFVLRRWQRRLEHRQLPWFVRRSFAACLCFVALAFGVWAFSPHGDLLWRAQHVIGIGNQWNFGVLTTLVASGRIAFVLRGLIWFWWCDRPPRRRSAVAVALVLFAGLNALFVAVPSTALSHQASTIGDPGPVWGEDGSIVLGAWRAEETGVYTVTKLLWKPPVNTLHGVRHLARPLLFSGTTAFVFSAAALFAYSVAQWMARRGGPFTIVKTLREIPNG